MTQVQKEAYANAFEEMNTSQCMVFNTLTAGMSDPMYLAELQTSGATYSGSVSVLANEIGLLGEEEKLELCLYVKENVLTKKYGGRPCETR